MIREYGLRVDKETGISKLYRVKTYKELHDESDCCNSPEKIKALLENVVHLTTFAEERVYAVYLNTKCRVLGISMISHGTVNATVLTPREVFQRALLIGATHVVIVHNHPSQIVEPSKDDIDVTERLVKCGKLLSLTLVDSIIVGKGYYSFKESGKL